MAVRIVCDSTTYLTGAQISSYGIEEVSLSVVWGDQSRREVEITDLDSFYDELREMDNLPTTSQPSVGQFLEAYHPIVDAGDEIVSMHFSSGISGTYNSAVQAREQLLREGVEDERVTVIDTGSACGGYGLLALAAASKAHAGGSRDEVLEAYNAMAEGLSFWFAIDTLEYLRRGGRIGAVASLLGTAIRIKPILTVTTEGIIPVERVRTEGRVLARMVDLAVENVPDGGDYIVQHVQAPDRAQIVIDGIAERLGKDPAIQPAEIGPVIGAHVGPGLIGVGVFPAGLVY
ncbi:MAG: DegV family protein [Thermoleophilia bacterium]|nr:DegV family protein [Thermoleophilia bacterium]